VTIVLYSMDQSTKPAFTEINGIEYTR